MNCSSIRFLTGLLGGILSLGLSACGKLQQPREGSYRAAVELPGGELPFLVEIGGGVEGTSLWVLHETGKQAATHIGVQDGKLNAELPNAGGNMQVSMSRSGLDGVLRLGGKELKLHAEHGARYRFFKESTTDNADVSGSWRLECKNTNASLQFELKQTHDQVDGLVRNADGSKAVVEGQVHQDNVSLGALGAGLALLYKAQVDKRGHLEGELWQGMAAKQVCTALPESTAQAS